MGTKNNPSDFDCYANAEPDEPTFTLLARDPVAADLVRDWIRRRYELRLLKTTSPEKINEAAVCANEMEAWYRKNRQ